MTLNNLNIEQNSYNWNKEPIFDLNGVRDSTYSHIDLFSGCGGFSVGFEQAGFNTDVSVDIHPQSIDTIKKNHKNTSTILGDIRKVDPKDVKNILNPNSKFSVVTAGVPCQGFSLSNRKRNKSDERNFLFLEFIRFAEFLQPDAVILENVSGLASLNDGQFKNDISLAIKELGYHVHFKLLNAADYGVPQNRRRVFFIGVKDNVSWLFPDANYGTEKEKYNTVKDAIIGDLPSLKNNEESYVYSGQPVSKLQKYLRGKNKILHNHKSPNHPSETINKIRNTKQGKPMYENFKQRIRLDNDLPSPTQVCGGIRPQFQFGHPSDPRGLTIRERARIQSFPDSYIFEGGTVQGRVQTGNAVPPLLAKSIATQLKRAFEQKKLKGIEGDYEHAKLF